MCIQSVSDRSQFLSFIGATIGPANAAPFNIRRNFIRAIGPFIAPVGSPDLRDELIIFPFFGFNHLSRLGNPKPENS